MKKTFIIAEAGTNHNGKIGLAKKLVEVAADAGVDAIKFQTFDPERLVSKNAQKASYQEKNTPSEESSQREMLERMVLGYDQFRELKQVAQDNNLYFMTSSFGFESFDLIEDLIEIIKIPSGEINNLPFLEYLANKDKPIIMSTGMSTLAEVSVAVDRVTKFQNTDKLEDRALPVRPFSLLHCTSCYPCRDNQVNLKAINTLESAFQLPVGYSDHTLGIEIPIAATALGANIVEKHFTLDSSLDGPDHKASLEPAELDKMVNSIRKTEEALGSGRKIPQPCEEEIKQVARKSLIASQDVPEGTKITRDHIAIKRPGTGIPPTEIEKIAGLTLQTDLEKDEVMEWRHFKAT